MALLLRSRPSALFARRGGVIITANGRCTLSLMLSALLLVSAAALERRLLLLPGAAALARGSVPGPLAEPASPRTPGPSDSASVAAGGGRKLQSCAAWYPTAFAAVCRCTSLAEIDCTGRNFASGIPSGSNFLAGYTNLTRVKFTNCQLSSLPAGLFAGLASLQEIHLGQNFLTALPDGIFAGLPSLTRISLNNNKLASLSDGVFAGAPMLATIELQTNLIVNISYKTFAGNLTSVVSLNMASNLFTTLPAAFANLTSLEYLGVGDSQTLTSVAADAFTGLSRLRELSLAGQKALTTLPAGVFTGLTSLQYLRLGVCALASIPDSAL